MAQDETEVMTAVVDPATGMFCSDGMAPGRIVVEVPDTPDPKHQRYSGDPTAPIREATDAEMAAYDAAQLATKASALMDLKQKAWFEWSLTRELKRRPTTQELTAARAQLAGIYAEYLAAQK